MLSFTLKVFFSAVVHWGSGCKKSRFSFTLTMTLGTIILFLIEAHRHTIRKNLSNVRATHTNTHITQTRTRSNETHHEICTIVATLFCFSFQRNDECTPLSLSICLCVWLCFVVIFFFHFSLNRKVNHIYQESTFRKFLSRFWYSDFITCVYIISVYRPDTGGWYAIQCHFVSAIESVFFVIKIADCVWLQCV